MAKSESEKERPPSLADFNQEAVKRVVRKEAWQHPLTLYPTAIGVVGGVALALLDPTLFTFLVTVGGLCVGGLSWIVNYCFRDQALRNRYLDKLNKKMVAHREKQIKELKKKLDECKTISGGEEYALLGQRQFDQIGQTFAALIDVLDDKLNPQEETYRLYYGQAELAQRAVLEKLQEIVNILRSIRAIDVNEIELRLKQLARMKNKEEADLQEEEALKKRLTLRKDQLSRVNSLITFNEQTITQMNELAANWARTITNETVSEETLGQDLENLVKQTGQYSYESGVGA